MEKIGYVYLTTNLVNGKMYVGQHLSNGFDKYYKGSGHYIKRAFDKYGWDNFKCEVICWCSTQTQLNEAEDNYIRLLDTMSPNGYNLKGGGANGRYSKESRKKMSEAMKKYYANEENRKKTSEVSKKCWKNEETRKKHSEALKGQITWNKGKRASEETRKKQSEAMKGKTPWIKGKHHTEESRKKISEAHKGRVISEKAREKVSETVKKCWKNEEYRKKLSKKVYQYTKGGVFVREWCSTREIERVLGYNNGYISACCNGKYKYAYDCLWSYEPLN